MGKTLTELRAEFDAAERAHRAAYRRAQWLEKRLFEATTETEYQEIAAQLDAQETALDPLNVALIRARSAYIGAELSARASA